jgi:hypothetical protein
VRGGIYRREDIGLVLMEFVDTRDVGYCSHVERTCLP